jgi:hypothetical protein
VSLSLWDGSRQGFRKVGAGCFRDISTPRRHPFFRPLGDSFRDDLIGAIALLVGAALAAVVFDNFAVLVGAAIGVTLLVIGKAARRRLTRRPDGGG